METTGERRSLPGGLFGVALATMGLAMTASNVQLLPFEPTLLDFAPFFFLIVALDRVLVGRYGKALVMVAAALLCAWVRLDPDFRLDRLKELWPLGLVLVGVVFVIRAFNAGREAGGPGGDLAFFSSVRSALADPAYRGGLLVAMLGAHRLDLRRATLADDGAVLEIFAFWGGIEVIVPDGWQVQLQVHALLGGGEDKTRSDKTGLRPQVAGTPALLVRGLVVMGGVEIHR